MNNLIGKRYGRYTVLHRAPNRKSDAGIYWVCQCDCGNVREVRSRALTSGVTKSCGCYMRDAVIERRTLPNNQGKINRAYSTYKRDAERRNYPFELSMDEFMNLIDNPCTYCGKTAEQVKQSLMGIDRQDNTKGYIKGNVVPCCGRCNRAKDTYSVSEYEQWLLDSFLHKYRPGPGEEANIRKRFIS